MNSWTHFSQSKILAPEDLDIKLATLKRDGKTVATLNGAFDLLHAGHMYMLFEAARQADVLLVALNSDASIRTYKGEDRPIITLEKRLEMLTAIEFVDYVTWFEEANPCALLAKIRPDVHVNGEEYGQECIESATLKKCGTRLHLVKRIPDLATSEIIEKIGKACV